MNEEVAANRAAIRSWVYEKWDADPESPPKTRPSREAVAEEAPKFEVLAWTSGGPVWPGCLTQRFPEGSDEFNILEAKKAEFLIAYPQSRADQQSVPLGTARRAGGVCDFSLDGAREPLDVTRMIELPTIKKEELQCDRPESGLGV